MKNLRSTALGMFIVVTGCSGQALGLLGVTGPNPVGPTGPAVPNDPGGAGPIGTSKQALHRMTRSELINTVSKLSGGTVSLSEDALPVDAIGSHGFSEDTSLSIGNTSPLVDALVAAAPAVRTHWQGKIPCQTEDESCAKPFIEGFGLRAFRRPLQEAETEAKLADYRLARKELKSNHTEALEYVVASFLLSPYFLYHAERKNERASVGTNGWVALDPYELASKLSYALWQSMPDDELLEAAANGRLETQAQLLGEAQRMMKDDRLAGAVQQFVRTWAGLQKVKSLQKDANAFPQFSKALASDFAAESDLFTRKVLLEGSGSFRELITAPYTYVNASLARFYGLPAVSGESWVKSDLNVKDRRGLFTQGAYLAAHALPAGNSPPRRAKPIIEGVLCLPAPPPDPSLNVQIPPPIPNQTVRQSFTEATKPAACAGCHRNLNAFGFAFEKYDAVGAIQTVESGQPVDASVVVDGVTYDGAPDLLLSTVQGGEVAACLTLQLFRFIAQRRETENEAGSIAQTAAAFAADDLKLGTALGQLVQSNSFRFRLPNDGEQQ